jgi:hypothetical protein
LLQPGSSGSLDKEEYLFRLAGHWIVAVRYHQASLESLRARAYSRGVSRASYDDTKQEKEGISQPTPRAGVELLKQLDLWRGKSEGSDRSKRSILRKAAKALDNKNFEIATLQHQKRALEQQLEDMKPKKRAKVVPNPNHRFVQLPQIQKAQQLAAAKLATGNRSQARQVLNLAETCLDL